MFVLMTNSIYGLDSDMNKAAMPKSVPVWKTPDPVKKPHHLSGVQKNRAKAWAKSHGVVYPSLIANMHAKKMKK